MRLTGRKSFITGAAKGIGLSVARAFAAEGAAVALADISEEESKKAVTRNKRNLWRRCHWGQV